MGQDEKEKDSSRTTAEQHRTAEKEQIVRPKISPQKYPTDEECLITFSRQKLALLQSEYDPKSCNGCGKSSTRLKQCVKCKVATYCSKECQTKDWKVKHRRHCKEIRRLQAILPAESADDETSEDDEVVTPVVREIYAKKCGKSFRVGPSKVLHPRTCSLNDMLIFYCTRLEGCLENNTISVYKSNGTKIDSHRLDTTEWINDLCICHIASSVFLAVSISVDDEIELDDYSDRIDFYKDALPSQGSLYSYTDDHYTINKLNFFDNKILVYRYDGHFIEEFDVSEFPIKPTGHRIPTGVHVLEMCAMFQKGQKTLVIQHEDNTGWHAMSCLDYNGQKLWEIGGVHGETIPYQRFHPTYICTDEKEYIFAVDPAANRVCVINTDMDYKQTLLMMNPYVYCVSWDETRQRLYVVHADRTLTYLIASQYKIVKK